MRLRNVIEIDEFLGAINACKGNVYLMSAMGDKYNLRSTLTQYIAISALLGEKGDQLDLYCDDRADEALFMKFFGEHPETM